MPAEVPVGEAKTSAASELERRWLHSRDVYERAEDRLQLFEELRFWKKYRDAIPLREAAVKAALKAAYAAWERYYDGTCSVCLGQGRTALEVETDRYLCGSCSQCGGTGVTSDV